MTKYYKLAKDIYVRIDFNEYKKYFLSYIKEYLDNKDWNKRCEENAFHKLTKMILELKLSGITINDYSTFYEPIKHKELFEELYLDVRKYSKKILSSLIDGRELL